MSRNKYIRYILNAFKLEYIFVYASIILSAGIVAYLLNASLIPPTNIIIIGNLQAQSIIETLIYGFVIVMGVAGAFLLARSAGDGQMDRVKGIFFLAGLGLLLLSFVMIYSLWSYKIFG
ncbi:MAG: hypothetical protein QXX17_04655 [Conexivisphaerales archaeon]